MKEIERYNIMGGVGKTTILYQLACEYAQTNKKNDDNLNEIGQEDDNFIEERLKQVRGPEKNKSL